MRRAGCEPIPASVGGFDGDGCGTRGEAVGEAEGDQGLGEVGGLGRQWRHDCEDFLMGLLLLWLKGSVLGRIK